MQKYKMFDCVYMEIPEKDRLVHRQFVVCKNGNREEFGMTNWVVVQTIINDLVNVHDPLGFNNKEIEMTIGAFFDQEDAELFAEALFDKENSNAKI